MHTGGPELALESVGKLGPDPACDLLGADFSEVDGAFVLFRVLFCEDDCFADFVDGATESVGFALGLSVLREGVEEGLIERVGLKDSVGV